MSKVIFVESTDLRNNLADYFNRVIYQDQEFIITRRNIPIARINKISLKERMILLTENPELRL